MSVSVNTSNCSGLSEELVFSIFGGEVTQSMFRMISQQEQAYLSRLCEKKQLEFVRGRCAAKTAIAELESDNVAEVSILRGQRGEPIVSGSDCCVSISHSKNTAVALAFRSDANFGVDIEHVNAKFVKSLRRMTNAIVEHVPDNVRELTIAWTLKESLSKCLKTGLTIAFENLAFSEFHKSGEIYTCCFSKYPLFLGKAILKNDVVLAIVGEKSVVSEIDISHLL